MPVLPGSRFCGNCGHSLEIDDRQRQDTVGHSRGASDDVSPFDSLFSDFSDQMLTTEQQNALMARVQSLVSPALAQKMRTSAFELQGERRDVTVLFLDVMSFTRSAGGLDSEDIYLIVDEAMKLVVQVVHRYEGTIDKFTGEGLMALFGAPVAHEDDAERAVRAALDIQTVLQPLHRRLYEEHNVELLARVGINRGGVIAGQLGSNLHMEYTVIGDTANLAARLQQAARPGQILVSAEVQQQTLPIFRYRAVPPLTLKGYDGTIPAFEPMGIRNLPGRVRGIPGIHASMVGRVAELQQLHGLWAEVQRTGKSRIALISGEAGLGKSRLVAEFRESIAHANQSVFEGSCLAYTRSNPFWGIASLLRDILHIEDADSQTEQQEKLYGYIHRFQLTQQRIIPYLVNLLGMEQPTPALQEQMRSIDATMLRRQTHTSVRLLLQAEARLSPIVVVLEDIHWIDPASAELLVYLINSLIDSPILLLCNSREYERQTTVEPILRAMHKHPNRFTDIQLSRLSEGESHELLAGIFASVDDSSLLVRQSIVERAEGIPFYMEEIVRMLMDRELLQFRDGRLLPAPNCVAEMANLPGTLKSLILARFDTLDGEERLLLRHAAVIGRSFPVKLLLHLGNSEPAALEARLRMLVQRLFLSEEHLHNENGFVFRHALIQEAVYSTLLNRDRKPLHGLVSEVIEEGGYFAEDERPEILAYHLGRSEEPIRAVPHLVAAAEIAQQRSAHETALQHYKQGLKLLESSNSAAAAAYRDSFFRLSIGLGQTLKLLGAYADASHRLAETVQILTSQQLSAQTERIYLIEALRELADVRQREGNLGKALLHIEDAIAHWRKLNQPTSDLLWYGLQDRLAWIRFRQGNLDEAAEMATNVIYSVETQSLPATALLASLYNTLGGVYYQKRATSDAVGYVERSLRLHDSLGYAWGKAIAATNLGLLHYVTGMWGKAEEWYTWAVNVCRENGFVAERAVNLRNLGLLYISQGEHAKGAESYWAALQIARQIGDSLGAGCCHMGLALHALRTGQSAQAEEHLQQAQAGADAFGEDNLVQLHLLQARFAHSRHCLDEAIEVAGQALKLAISADLAEEQMEAERIYGVLLSAAGRQEEAEKHLRTSVELCRRRFDPYRLGQALYELASHYWFFAQESPSRRSLSACASTALEEATTLLRGVGAGHDLRLAESLLLDIQRHPAGYR